MKKIAVIGPESTGKSMLCEQLAAHYNTIWVKEYAREYLHENGSNYVFEDLHKIAKGQISNEEKIIGQLQKITSDEKNNSLIFIDTDLQVIKIWSEFVFNKCDNRILTEISKRKYDLYLFCNIDLPWVKDELREYPDIEVRKKLFHYYHEELTEQKTPWLIISGNYTERIMSAVDAVKKIL